MESSVMRRGGEEPPPPDSWETADLEEQVMALNLNNAIRKEVLNVAESDKEAKELERASPEMQQEVRLVKRANNAAPVSPEELEKVDSFLREALQNPRDRLTILRMEQEVEKFMRNSKQQVYEFQPMASSYYRLAAHRVAQHYLLQTHAAEGSDGEGGRIIARKTAESKSPAVRLWMIQAAPVEANATGEKLGPEKGGMKLAIRQRPRGSLSSNSNSSSPGGNQNNPVRSVEERKEEYNRARARIFSSESLRSLAGSEDESLQLSRRSSAEKGADLGQDLGGTEVEEGHIFDSLHFISKSEERGRGGGSKESSPGGKARSGAGGGRDGLVISEDGSGRGQKPRVAILRDREKERRDPDFNRNLDRYVQRFDQGFGIMGATPYGIQPLYAPLVTYNTEFPALGNGPGRPLSGNPLGLYPETAQTAAVPSHVANNWTQAAVPQMGATHYATDPMSGATTQWSRGGMGVRASPTMVPMYMPTAFQQNSPSQQLAAQQNPFPMAQQLASPGVHQYMANMDQYQTASLTQHQQQAAQQQQLQAQQQVDMHYTQQTASRRR